MPSNHLRIPSLNVNYNFLSPRSRSYAKMADRDHGRKKNVDMMVLLSYAFDWAILVAVGIVGLILGEVTPNKRHFSLQDPNIAFPITEHETVDSKLLLICNAVIPVAVVLVVTLIFVPGPTVPEGTPKSMIWRRKLWELHTGWLGLALSLICAWIITQGMKNLFGKPRPDMLSRCVPDAENFTKYLVGYSPPADSGGPANSGPYNGQLVSADICTSDDKAFLDDGFRSYPSGHSSSAAAGLIYLSLFLASKFAITLPFVPHDAHRQDTRAVTAFPSRLNNDARDSAYHAVQPSHYIDEGPSPDDPAIAKQIGAHNSAVLATRLQAAAPPLYLLVLTILPFFLAIFVASSRWFDFRHHGFDILFGFIIGTICAFFSFRYYHMPIRSGAGWAWGPRSHDKAFWAGLGSWSYATDRKHWVRRPNSGGGLGATNASVSNLAAGHGPSDIELGIRQRAKTDEPTEYRPQMYRPESTRPIVHDDFDSRM